MQLNSNQGVMPTFVLCVLPVRIRYPDSLHTPVPFRIRPRERSPKATPCCGYVVDRIRAPPCPISPHRQPVDRVFLAFLALGLTSFGGPVAHIGYFREAFVARRGWLDERGYADLVALCQMLPGPTSSQVGDRHRAHQGGARGGVRGVARLHGAVGDPAGGSNARDAAGRVKARSARPSWRNRRRRRARGIGRCWRVRRRSSLRN